MAGDAIDGNVCFGSEAADRASDFDHDHSRNFPSDPLLLSSMHIRRYDPGEEPALRAIFRSSVHGLASRNYTQVQIEAWSPSVESPQLLEQWIHRIQTNQPWVVEVDGRLAAFADLQQSGYIDHFFVAAEFAGQGIGKALMLHLHDVARSNGIDALSAHVSLTAQPFFRRCGFQLETEQRPVIRGVELENAVMRKQLTSATQ